MSKVKKSGTSRYEILYIIANKFSEEEARDIDAKVEKIIQDKKGIIISKHDLGKRQLAYDIKHFKFGYYKLIVFDILPKEVFQVDRLVRMLSEILRHCIVNYVSVPVASLEHYKDTAKEVVKEGSESVEKEKAAEEVIIETEEKTEEIKSKKSEKPVKDLDAKLDDILEAKDLF